MATPSIPNKLLAAPLLALLLAACDTELTAVAIDGLDAPGTPSITSFSEVNGEAEVSWSKLSGADGNNWRLYRNDLNICEEALAPSADGSQSGSCSVMLEEGTNQLYVRLCNIDSSGSSACSESNTYTHNYQPEDQSDLPPGAITLEELSSPTYEPELYVAWSKASGVNGDSWGIYRDEALVCSGSLADSSSQVPQSGGCYVELEIGVNQLYAELCIIKPVGIDDLCTQSASASVTRDYDPGQILAQPILDDLATSAVIGPLTVAWSKDTSLGTLGETWSLYHNDSEICSGELAADASGASCLVDIALGANQLQVELCTEFYTYSGASCTFSEALSVEGGYPSAVEPGAIDLRSSYLSETYEATVSARWAIDSGNGVQSWMVLVNGSSYCAIEATETYHLDGECEQVGLELGDNNISVYGCNYGLDGSEACIYSDSKSVLRLELPGQAEIIDLPASSYDGELELSWERTSGASAESWLALVDDEIACPQTDLSADAATQSGSCTIELASGHNSVVVRLCVADSQASSYCSDSDTGSVELLAPIPGIAVITTASQTIAAASITLEWEKSSGEAAATWQLYNNSLPAEECAGVPEGNGAQQQGSCSLPLEEGTNLILIELCNSNAAGTASCSSSTSVSIDRELVTPAFTSSASATVPENTLSSFYTASASDSDSASSSLSFFITGGVDSSFFGIDDASGALSFSASPDFEAAADSDGDNTYEVILEVFDEHRNGDSLALQVSLSDLDDTAPTFTSAASTTISENSSGVIYLASAIDADSTSWSFALADGADSSHFELNSSSGELSPTIVLDFENPQDSNQDNTYELGLTATDPAANSSELSLSITVSGEYDEAPVVPQEPQAIAVQLGELSVGSVIYSVAATDSDAGDQLTYTLSGVDAGHFNLDSSSGELSFLNLPTSLNDPQDANGDHIYETAVSVHDLGGNSSGFDLNISVAFGAPPEFNSAAASVEFPENSAAVVYTAAATDPEGDAITYSLGGADVDLFTIDTGSGAISFNTIPDYEAPSGTDNNYNLNIFASDPLGNQSQQSLEVTVTNLNDNAPEFASASDSVGVSENNSGTIYTASATDVDNDSLVYSVAGADVNLFAIAISSGELRFINAPDYENPSGQSADNTYEVEVIASDGDYSAALTLAVTVEDINDNVPAFVFNSDLITVDEGESGVIYTAAATDLDAIDILTYSLTSADADSFGIDSSSGELSFITAPDYENPLDADSDNVYELTIDASDGVNHDSLALVVEVIDLNDNGPRFASSSDSVSVPENNTGTIYTASATDADDDDLSYGLAGVDAALFTLDPGSGELAFVAAPDFENPLDADADNAYELEISASDGISSSTLALSVVVTDANDNAPGFALESDAIAVEEGISGTIYTASATDPDVSDSLTYSLTGTDSSLFSVDSSSGELSFKNAPDFESPLDQGADNTYELTIQATDGANNTSLALSVAVEGINDNSPEFVTNSDSITVEEDASGTIYTAVATDLDGDSLRYGLSGTDSSLFAVNANNGVVSFANPPDFENPLDQGGDNTYELNIQASDGTSSATLALTVVVIDINDNFPSFALTNDSVAVAENSGGTIYTATATDLDATDSLTYSLAGTDYSYFAIDGSSGALSFKNSPDFENPLDQGADNTYELNIQASDGVNASALTLSVAVNNLNDNAPGFGRDSFSLSTAENNSDTIYTAAASDADGDTLAYSLAGTDASLFSIDSANGELSFATAPDFEGAEDSNNDNSYELEIVASDGEQSAALALQVSVTDLNDESPQVTSFSSLALSIFDITLYDVIYTATATDADAGDQLSYALSGADASHFQLGSISGELSFIQSPSSTSPRDADANNVYEIIIKVSDSANNSSSFDLRITLDTEIGNPPVFDLTHDQATISENSSGVFYTAVATDPEGNVVTFGLMGTDASYFSIDSASGELSVGDPLDYEQPRDSGRDNNYTLTILASDHIGNQAQQGLDVLVSNVNDNAPEFALLSDTVAVAENSTGLIYTASASDADGGALTYSLGGDDAALFDIGSSSGELFFYAAPDYEQALDSDQDNSYNLTITAFDGASSAGLALTITITNLNDTAPQFELSSDSFSVAENSTAVTTIAASDADGDDLTFALVSSADSSRFSLDPGSGVLAFASAPDFETPADDDSNNVYELGLSVFDGTYTTSAAVNVIVTNLDEAPGFAAATAYLSIEENNDSIIYTAAASDPEQAALSYSASGADATLFNLNATSGELSFISAPDYENPLGDGSNSNTYQLDITASDGANTAIQVLTIAITDVNEPPGFATTSVNLTTEENNLSFAYTAEAATDPDQNEQLSYQLSGSDQAAFSFDANTRTLSFATTPDYENPADQDQANDYEVSIIASDGEYQSTQTITITVTNLDEAPGFAAATLNLSIPENNGSIIYTAAASDPEQAALVYSASGPDADLFNLNASSGELSFISAPDYEAPLDQSDNNTYQLDITASDGEHEASQALSITITDVNEAPGFATASVDLSTAENNLSFAYTAEAATDPDQNEQLSYQLSGTDETAFSFDANTRTLSFATTPDYENPADQDQANDYEVSIVASDGEYQSTQTISISVGDLNDESPLFTSPSSQAVDYTTVKIGDVVYTAQATDADSGDQVSYTLGGADASDFDLDSASGALVFNQLPSFEEFLASGGVTYQLTITGTDLASNSNDLSLTINLVDDTGNPPEFSQASVSINVDENTASSVYTAQATDSDPGDTLTYSIAGIDADLFTIDPSSGELSFNTAPDYEQPADNGKDNTYELSVAATDGIGKQAQQSLEITVNNLNDNHPQFALTSNSFSVAENTTAVTTVAASDADGDDFTFALVNTADSNLFSLDSSSGALSFNSAPDFETPLDAGTDNTYELELSVFDGDYTTTQEITIAVTNIDEAPSFAIVTVDLPVSENTSGSIYTAQATDPEGATLTYSASGADASLFTLDSTSGDLAFKNSPNYEQALDSDADNTYQLDLTASDGALTSSQTLSITITDVNEPHSFASTSVNLLIDENNLSFAYIVEAAVDQDQNQQLTYQLGGTDQAAFDFDASTRTLSFKANPDFETPADADGQNDYQVSITAADADYSASQDIAISVADVNDEAPRFTSLSSQAVDYTEVSVGEIIYTATATDADAGDQISFTLGGADASYFIFNGSNGWLAFNQLPDLEDVPEDTGIAYEITITATDLANNSSVLDLTIRLVDDTGSSPEFDQASANIAVDENTAGSFYTAVATDVDVGDTLTYSLTGIDADHFTIDPSGGQLAFNSAPDYEAPADYGANNVYELSVAATDSIGKQAQQSLTITVINLNDNSPQFDLTSDSFDISENTTAVTTIAATDADGDDLSFALISTTDSNLFTIDPASGALAFTSAPDFENPADNNTDNTYELELSVFDGSHTTTEEITITVTNVDESPSFASANESLSVSENTGDAVYQAQASDPEGATLTYSSSGADVGLFTLDSTSGELSFKQSPDYEQATDQDGDNVYELTITASDGANQVSQSLAITVTNVNEAPAFASASVNLNTDENAAGFTHIVDAADDPDQGETLTYQLGGDDAAAFDFDAATRVLSFKATPDYESPADQGTNNVYQVTITAADAEYSTTQAITITVADLNDESPQFTSASSLVLDYTSVAVDTTIYTVQATDADAGDQITYTLSGADQQHFSFAASSGELAFVQAPSLESPKDDNGDNSYELVITATDSAGNSSDLDLSISVVDDTGTAPTFDQASASINVDENSASAVYTAQASDVDPGDTLTYSISGTDSSYFTIDPSSGDLNFNTAPDYESPSDDGKDNTYELSITATDSMAKQAQQSLTISINNLNDNAPQFDLSANSFDVAENTTAVTTVSASDADGDDLTFALTSTTDSNLFTLDSTSGALAFISAPDFETPQDSNADNTYDLELNVFDGANTTTQSVSVTVTNVDESPSFASASQSLSVSENSSGAVYQAQASDPEQATLTYSAGGADANLFTLDSISGELAFNTSPNYEQPTDDGADNTYNLTITATDGANQASQSLSITVTNVNEAPSFASTSVSLNTDENAADFTHIVEAATDPDQGETLTYQLGGDDAADFNFDSSTRSLSFANTPDFETPTDQDSDNAYQIDIIASDGEYETTQSIVIVVTDLNDEAPQFTSASSLVLDYTSVVVGTTIYTAQATDADAGDSVVYTLGGADSSAFSFDSSSGELAFTQLPSLDSPQDDNGDNSYELVITATDSAGNSNDLDLSINVVDDTGSAPTFDQASVSINVDENTASSVYTAQATDSDPGDTLTYSISGTDSSLFTINPSSGDLSFNSAPDFENPSDNGKDNTYELSITATDSMAKQANQSLAITILNLNDNAPQFDLSANSFDVAENTTAITTVAADDVDGDDLTFSLTNSTDASFFSLDSTSGVLAFASAPDFENPADNNADNTYDLELNVFDGSHTTTQSISVTVTNVDESPSFASASQSLSVSENSSGAVYQAQASDPEQATLTYSASGTDAELFTINSSSGELSFKNPPDFETPGDSGADNVYNLTITASDGTNQVNQSLAITVTNVNEAPAFASASVNLNTDENDASFTHTVDAADDPDSGQTLAYQLGGDDAADFNFDSSTRALSFKQTPDFESPTDQGANNVYQITITASDADYSTTQAITITVADLNDEAPQFTSAASLALDYTSVVVGTTIYTVQATDADLGDQITYALSGADASHFSFDSSSGALAFSELPSLENPKDADKDNVYQLSITATDSAGNSSDLDLSIKVVDDTGSAPTFTQASVSIDVDENTASTIYTAQATDSDPGDSLTYSIDGTDAELFTINSSSGELSFNSAPDFENPSDNGKDNTYDLTITATDTIGKSANQDLTITILNLNDNAPQFALASSAFDVLENSTSVATIAASDPDGDDLTFSLTNSTDASFFTLDSSSGVLAFTSAPDFETAEDSNTDNTYELELSVFDGAHTTTQSISVKVTNVDEAPSFTATNQNPSVSENTSGSFYTASASDPENTSLNYSTSGTDASLFTLGSSSGELSFKSPPDYESPADQGADNTYNLDIIATDGANSASQSLAITVTNVNEAPSFASASVNLDIDENDASFTHTVDAADDPDSGQTLAYQLGGDDAADFNFDSSTRALSFKQTPDFESPTDQNTDNAYQITITASDGDLEATQAITITVANVEESPYFHSTTDHIEITEDPATEGLASPILALTIQAADDEDDSASTSLNFVISGGADSDKFSLTAIDTNSANLSFKISPDFDNPHDSNLDSNYSLTIQVTDSSGAQAQHDLIVQVLGVNDETPQLSSGANADVTENSTAIFYVASATDADRSDWSDSDSSKHYQPNLDSITFSLDTNGYPDSSFFSINSSSGELQATSGLDYENPQSSALSNYYTVGIEVADSAANSSVNIITVTVIDDPDEPEPVASSGPQIPWFYSDVSVGESIDIPWVIYSGDGAISWSMLVNGTTVCSESASISDPATSGVCSVSSNYLSSGSTLNNTAVSVTYSDSSSELSDEVTFAYAASSAISFPSPSSSQAATACQGVDVGDVVNATNNSACYDYLLGDDDFGGPHDQVPSYLDPANGRDFEVIAYFIEWGVYSRDFQPADLPANLLSTALFSFVKLKGDDSADPNCESCSFTGEVDLADGWAALSKSYATDTWCDINYDDWTVDSACKANGIFKQFWLLKQKFPHLKTCVSVGGWSFSRPFPLVAENATMRATFADSIVDMAEKYHFDCIDIDWEFPIIGGGDYKVTDASGNPSYDYDLDGNTPFLAPSDNDAQYFANLIQELRAEIDSRGLAIDINSAMYSGDYGMSKMDYNLFAGNLHGIHMMTYDFYGAWDPYTGMQAALFPNSDPLSNEVALQYPDAYNNQHNIASAMARAVNNAIDNGFESNTAMRRKIVPGLAFYGRNYSGVSTTPVPGAYMVLAHSAAEQLSWEQGNLNYVQLKGYYDHGETLYGNGDYDGGGYNTGGRSWTYNWDEESQTPFLYDSATQSFVSYTDPRGIFYQTCHAARENSKGVMFWEISGDSEDSQLVNAIHAALRGDTLSQYTDQPHCDDIIGYGAASSTSSDDDDDGGSGNDDGGGNDDDGGDTGGGDTGGDTSSGTSGLQELEDLGYFTETVFNSLFYNTTLNQGSSTDGACTGYSFFNNWLDLKEAATYYPDFAAEGSMEDRLRELAAFLANTSHETTGAWQTYALDPALGARYHYGYCFKEEVGCENQTSCTQYCDSANTEYGYACSLGTTYHGRGPIQFTWNYNYGPMSEVLYGNNNYTLLENPSILVTDAVISYRSALWFWMTVQAPKPSAHDVMIGNYSAEASKNRYPGFGMTINIINGGLECGTDDFAEAKNKNRLGFYLAYLKVLGDAYGSDIAPWVTESSTSITYGSTPANYSAFDLNEADLISRYTDVETYLSCKNMEHY